MEEDKQNVCLNLHWSLRLPNRLNICNYFENVVNIFSDISSAIYSLQIAQQDFSFARKTSTSYLIKEHYMAKRLAF